MKGDSRRRQLDFATELCKENGWLLDDSLTLQDLGVSAFRGRNAKVGALSDFLGAVQSGRVRRGSVLIIENIDRLSRNKVGLALQLFIQLLNHGITIVTADPRRTYTQDSINDIAGLIEPIAYMSRAYEESRMKSMRLRQVWGHKKEKAAAEGKPLTAMTPAWIELTSNGYRLIPDRAATVRAIFRMTAEGLGSFRIVRTLAADPKRYPPFGRSGRWNAEYVNLILNSRSTFGEHQRYAVDPESGKKYPQGDPLRNYFPAAITEQEFYQARAAVQARKQTSGRPSQGETNLFTGMVYHAVDKGSMHLRSVVPSGKRNRARKRYRYLTSKEFKRGGKCGGDGGRFGRSFEYTAFEQAVLAAVAELQPADLRGRGQEDGHEEAIRSLTEELIALDQKQRAHVPKSVVSRLFPCQSGRSPPSWAHEPSREC